MNTNLKKGKNAVEERLRKYARPVTSEEMDRMQGHEDRSRRTRSSKIFSLGRGLYQAVMYPETVHFKSKETGELQEIDNTLIPVTDPSGETYLTNRANDDFRVEFHNAQDAAMILMQNEDGRMLSWKLENAQPVQPQVIGMPRPQHKDNDRRRKVLDHLEGEVLYENILPGINLNCSVQALRFKDFFTFNALENAQPVTFLLSMPDMIPEKMEDNSIQIIAPTGEVAFTLPKPFMKDASVEASYQGEELTREQQEALGRAASLRYFQQMNLRAYYGFQRHVMPEPQSVAIQNAQGRGYTPGDDIAEHSCHPQMIYSAQWGGYFSRAALDRLDALYKELEESYPLDTVDDRISAREYARITVQAEQAFQQFQSGDAEALKQYNTLLDRRQKISNDSQFTKKTRPKEVVDENDLLLGMLAKRLEAEGLLLRPTRVFPQDELDALIEETRHLAACLGDGGSV